MTFGSLFGLLYLAHLSVAGPRTPSTEDDAEFKPIMESELPEGFPGYTPVGQVQIKQYPAYRRATSAGPTAFWSLFSHIKRNDIAMTAPVEMTYEADSPGPAEERSMSFLYGNASLGRPGKSGRVQVADVPSMTVVSIGVRGGRTASSVDEARKHLKAWLRDASDRYASNGPVRVMAYNSPFVPRHKQFFEVQIPIRQL
jgi:hypothetical protein